MKPLIRKFLAQPMFYYRLVDQCYMVEMMGSCRLIILGCNIVVCSVAVLLPEVDRLQGKGNGITFRLEDRGADFGLGS